ncbi:hypothetical protein EK21DRAFT_21796, partial [Setomelanomma holmii]
PKRARPTSTATASDKSVHYALLPTKRRACNTPLRSPPLPAVADPQGCELPLTRNNVAQHTLSCGSQSALNAPLSPSPMS